MTDYNVIWEFDVLSANSPREAAELARAAQVRKYTSALVFNVTAEDGTVTRVDLLEDEDEDNEAYVTEKVAESNRPGYIPSIDPCNHSALCRSRITGESEDRCDCREDEDNPNLRSSGDWPK